MYRFFNPKRHSKGVEVNGNFIRIKKIYQENLTKVKGYYTENVVYINNRNVLVSLINNLPEIVGDESYYFRHIGTISDKLAAGLSISTVTNLGNVTKNGILSERTLFTSISTGGNWITEKGYKDIKAVVFLHHESRDITVRPPEIGRRVFEEGLCIIGIDIPLLALQFKRWQVENEKKESVKKESINSFISKNVIPNTIEELVDIGLRNRLNDLLLGIEIKEDRLRSPIATIDLTSAVDKEIMKVVDKIKRKRVSANQVMTSIPSLYSESYFTSVPKYVRDRTTYTYWVSLQIYIPWFIPIISGFNNINVKLDRLESIMNRVDKYVVGSRSMDYIKKEDRFNTLIAYNIIKDKINN